MAELAFLRPAETLSVDARLAEFVRHAREDLSVFGSDLDWDAPRWELRGVPKISGRPDTARVVWGHPLKKSPNRAEDYAPLDPRNVDFFKAFVRYRHALVPNLSTGKRILAIRLLDKALSKAGKSIADARCEDFNVAAAAGRSVYAQRTAYSAGRQLEEIARFLDVHGLVADPLAWICPIRRPTHFDWIGVERKRNRDIKLPSERAIAALGEAYCRARSRMDVIAVSVYALLLATHSRMSEVHRLDAYDCEVETVEGGKRRYGLRWYPSKGGQPETRWIPTAFEPLVRDALERIRDLTEPARELARKYAAGDSILPQDDPEDPLARDSYISLATLGTVTKPAPAIVVMRANGFDVRWELARDLGVPVFTNNRLYLRAPIEEGFRAELPEGFPLADAKSGLDYRRALLVRTGDMTARSRNIFWRLSAIRSSAIDTIMNGKRRRRGRVAGLFERLGLVDEDGETVRITAHQLRHYMTTLAYEGNLSQLDIARWAGRSDIRHNEYYDHETAGSLVSKARAVDEDMFGGELTVTPRRPVTAKEIMQGASLAVHVTNYGACLHDFAMSPCPMYRDCLNCVEHACVKGDERAERALRERLAVMEKAVVAAEEAAAFGERNSEIWLSRKLIELGRLRELMALIDDDTVGKGAVIRLNGEARYVIDHEGFKEGGGLSIPDSGRDAVRWSEAG